MSGTCGPALEPEAGLAPPSGVAFELLAEAALAFLDKNFEVAKDDLGACLILMGRGGLG
jgi:hypothetical protein